MTTQNDIVSTEVVVEELPPAPPPVSQPVPIPTPPPVVTPTPVHVPPPVPVATPTPPPVSQPVPIPTAIVLPVEDWANAIHSFKFAREMVHEAREELEAAQEAHDVVDKQKVDAMQAVAEAEERHNKAERDSKVAARHLHGVLSKYIGDDS